MYDDMKSKEKNIAQIQTLATQDKGVFLFLHILNEILWYIEI